MRGINTRGRDWEKKEEKLEANFPLHVYVHGGHRHGT